MKKGLRTALWLVVALAALAYLVWRTPRDDFTTAIGQMSWGWALAGVGLYFISQTILATRWVLLLEVHGVRIGVFQAIKLTYLGLFYNNMMPGAVGGDLLKAWYITRHSEKHQRVEAAVTVFVDRLVGLVGMIAVGAVASLFVGGELGVPIAGHMVQVRELIWAVLAMLVVAAVIFLSRRVRQALRLSWLLERLPFAERLRQIDYAIRVYRHHVGVMLVSLLLTALIQGMAIVAIWMLTRALALEQVTFLQVLVIMPIVWLVSSAIPVPGGLGVLENLFIPFFSAAINPGNPTAAVGSAVALALLNRMMICACSVPGAAVPLFGGHLPKAKEMVQEVQSGV